MSQADAILHHLAGGRSLTALDALQKFGCLRLAARVAELRDRGHLIACRIVERGGKRVGLYTLTRQR